MTDQTQGPPERFLSVTSLMKKLLALCEGEPTVNALDGLVSAYVTAAMRSPGQLPGAIRGMARVRRALMTGLPADRHSCEGDRVRELAVSVLGPDVEREVHDVGLSALLTVYRDILERHPCCHRNHAEALLELHKRFSAAPPKAEPSQPNVH